jgi:hypothetical protein
MNIDGGNPAFDALIAFLTLEFALCAAIGCGAPERPDGGDEAPEVTHEPGIPVIELPLVDFRVPQSSAKENLSPPAYASSLPAGEFMVRFSGRRGKVHFPAIIAIQQRTADGKIVEIADCTATPSGDLDQDIVTYEGTCRAPSRKGNSLIEVRLIGKTYLLLAAEIK